MVCSATRWSWRRCIGFALAAMLASAHGAALRAETVLRFVPLFDLRTLDPIWSLEYAERNHGYLVYDTLFSLDSKFQPQPQMVRGYTVSDDKLTYTFALRPGLKWHDGMPVRAADCVASLQRWGKRDSIGGALLAATTEMKVVDDATFQIILRQPFGHVISALAKIGSPVPFMMPERIARTDPFQQITEVMGSGPFIFVKDEWLPGSRVVYRKNTDYVPRDEPADLMAGGKRVYFDRLESNYIPNGATAVSALLAGEVDWVAQPPVDLLPLLRRNNQVVIRAVDPLGLQIMLRFNHIHPPFDDPKVRQAALLTINQQDYLQVLSDDPKHWRPCRSFFICGTRYGEDVLTDDLLTKESLGAARKLLVESSYKGQPVVILDAIDDPLVHNPTAVTAQNLKAIGFNVDVRATDGASVFALALKQNPVDQGGWNLVHQYADSTNYSNPVLNNALRAGGVGRASIGWPKSEAIETLRASFLTALTPEEQSRIARELQQEAYRISLYGLNGQLLQPTAYRTSLSGMIDAPIPVFWNLKKN